MRHAKWGENRLLCPGGEPILMSRRESMDGKELTVGNTRNSTLKWVVSLFFFVWVFILAFYLQGEPGSTTRIYETITVDEAARLIEEHKDTPDFVILDVRTPEEYEAGHLENAINIDFYSDDFEKELDALDRNKIYLEYCRSGGRSRSTLEKMKRLNFRGVYNMDGGFMTWRKKGYPFVR
jgi:rhodanese-related sulfurtransferase